MPAEIMPSRRIPAWALVSGAICWIGMSDVAHGFPAVDAATPSAVTPNTDETTDLTHLVGGGGFWNGVDLNAPGWTFTPSLSLQEVFNSNVLSATSNPRWDLTTLVSPGITVIGNTSRTTTRLMYSPTLSVYARTGDQNSIAQQLYGTSEITLSEDFAYLDVRAMAGVGATNGGFGGAGVGLGGGGPGIGGIGQSNALLLSKNNRTQIDTFGASPYLMHRFEDYGTFKIGYSVTRSESAATSGFVTLPIVGVGSNSQGGATQLLTNEEIAQFTTGEYFGKIKDKLLLDASQGSGSGTAQSSSQTILVNRLGYRVWDGVTAYGEIGTEDIRYSGTPATHINDAIWTVGVELTPNPDSTISIGYGHKYGTNSANFNASYALSPRTRISASYNHGLATDLQALQGSVAVADINQSGTLVDAQTGAPLFIGANAFGINNNLYQSDSYTGSVTTALDRDTFTASILADQRTVAASSTLAVGTSSHDVMGTLTWTRLLTPLLTSTLSGSYMIQDIGGTNGGTFSTYTANASLQYTLSDTVTTSAGYYHYTRSANTPGSSIYVDVVFIGVRKTF